MSEVGRPKGSSTMEPVCTLYGADPYNKGDHPKRVCSPRSRTSFETKPRGICEQKKRRLREQEHPDVHLWHETTPGGVSDNCASSAELEEPMREKLRLSVEKGQALRFTEAEARGRFGSKLVAAALGALVKSCV